MRKLNNLFYLSLALGSLHANAQQSAIYTDANAKFERAVALYNEQQYGIAQILFDEVRIKNTNDEIQAECAYYIANCAIRLGQDGAEEKINQFVYNYPTSSKQAQAYVDISDYYFKKGMYAESLQYSSKINENILAPAVRERVKFQTAYATFDAKNYNKAKALFTEIKDSEEYGHQAKYYLGYISYSKDEYSQAKEYFGEVADKEKYNEKMGYFKSDMNFKSGNFEQAIKDAKSQLPKATEEEQSELSKIIGESYFNLQQYDEALPYLLAYKGKNGRWNNTDFYQLGYTYYQQKQYNKAIAEFNKIIGGSDAVAQNAYYHLGESYLKSDMKTEALNAFKNASEMSFNTKIQEDAYVNYAKLSYEIGNPYVSVPEILTSFLAKYPNTAYKEEINDLLIDSYITSKNYKEALALLEKNRTPSNKLAYQKVTFYRGVELYGEGKYSQALDFFNKSIAERQDNRFVSRATYWRGEAEYALNRFSDAYNTFKTFSGLPQAEKTPEAKTLNYSLGYAAFKLKNYTNAAQHFDAYTKTASDGAKKNDAYLRMADSYFVDGKYWPAMEAYNKVIDSKTADVDYALYQKAISYGFVGRTDTKIQDLNKFITSYPQSSYADDALYELGNTYANENKNSEAITAFNKLIAAYPSSSYVSKAMLRQGLIYYNGKDNTKALERYKKVVAEYPGSPDAVEAVQSARLIYVDSGNTAEFAAWVKNLDFVDISNTDLDNDSFEAAEKQFVQNNNKQAISGFNEYLKTYPTGLNALKAHFNLGELYVSDNQNKNAIPHYEFVLSKSQSEYTEASLMRLATIYLSEKNNEKATSLLKQLEKGASYDQNKLFAQSNLMRIYYDSDDYTSAVAYADKVLANSKSDKRMKGDAQVIVARAAFAAGDVTKARKAYADLQKSSSGELAAEAIYYDAYFKNSDKKYSESNAVIQKLAKDYSGYKYFGAKGLIVMAKNFYGLKDSYQATYVLENVISNFTSYSDVVAEAKAELAKIKSEESKRNSSVK